MPELPDITVYIEHLESRILGRRLERIRFKSPFLLRSVQPQPEELEGSTVSELRRLGKRIVIGVDNERFLVLHLMIAGRLRWREAGAKIPGKLGLASFDFDSGSLILTEAGSKRRASLYLVEGEEALAAHDPGGVEPLDADFEAFRAALTRENHTLKRSLTDPRILSGIGNAYSDEILHRARLSPFLQTRKMDPPTMERLYEATQATLHMWVERLRQDAGDRFPEKVTAFRKEMAVHGRYGEPCPECNTAVQRIVYAQNECNYCAYCQTGGKLLADRALSQLLKKDWPRTVEDLERRRTGD